jgi:hypothetical protein
MHAVDLLALTGVSSAALREWVRCGLILPKTQTRGPGHHADYDYANAVAVGVAMVMVEKLKVPVGRYKGAFESLQLGLRTRSNLEWRTLAVALLPSATQFVRRNEIQVAGVGSILIDLEVLCASLVPLPTDPQLHLGFGLAVAS